MIQTNISCTKYLMSVINRHRNVNIHNESAEVGFLFMDQGITLSFLLFFFFFFFWDVDDRKVTCRNMNGL